MNKKPTPTQLLWELYNLQNEKEEWRKFANDYKLESDCSRILIREAIEQLVGPRASYKAYHTALVEYCKRNNKKDPGYQVHHVNPKRTGEKSKKVWTTNFQHNLLHYLLAKMNRSKEDYSCIKTFRRGFKNDPVSQWHDQTNKTDYDNLLEHGL